MHEQISDGFIIMKKALSIRVKGIVQGVGFRPFVYNAARHNEICGSVLNDTEGVVISAEGQEPDLRNFIGDLSRNAPPLAAIMSITSEERPVTGCSDFRIEESRATDERLAFYSPDVAVCDRCLAEFFDEGDRRYLYPFITCIHCGPRFSIVSDIPYDRRNTAMHPFTMCGLCRSEYADPADRRFHSQPNACPVCGPKMTLYDNRKNRVTSGDDGVARETVELLLEGKIVAIKGIGGYHLAADALNDGAVRNLRERKKRPFKPFAIMTGSIESAEEFLTLSPEERRLLLSKERPIVLVRERREKVSRHIAPGLTCMGIMLPYTPFQHHLFSIRGDMALVMTSGNVSDEPIEYRDGEVFGRLGRIADYFVTYDREIIGQGDDSVMYVVDEKPCFVRRSRGYVPAPLLSGDCKRTIFAIGGDLKNSFAITRKNFIILSQYLGDMADPLTMEVFKTTVRHFIKIFDAAPDVIVSDLHPSYLTKQHALEMAQDIEPVIEVQHHHAHIAAVMEENNLSEPVIGIAFDGTGYGTDGTLWGSEFHIVRRDRFERAAHFSNFPLPGGESAIREVWKIGLSMLHQCYGRDYPIMRKNGDAEKVVEIIEKNINSPLTCSIGRIFDGVSAILGISSTISTEAEAAQLLEEAAIRGKDSDPAFVIPYTDTPEIIISTEELTRYIVSLINTGAASDDIAARFHSSIINTSVEVCIRLRERTGINAVALSGGVFHNRILLGNMIRRLGAAGFMIYTHKSVPCNDGCIALGQIAVAKERINSYG
jgi:hydrogenase maturation protein HypF